MPPANRFRRVPPTHERAYAACLAEAETRRSRLVSPKPERGEGGKPKPVVITLNGERYELEHPLSVVELLSRLEIDPRRVAVEHNLAIIKRHAFSDVILGEGDTVEIVNFVGGG